MTRGRFAGRCRRMTSAQQPVGDVDVVAEVLGGGFLLQRIGHGHIQPGNGGQLLLPLREPVHIRKRRHSPTLQHGQFLRGDLRLPARGQPDEPRHDGGADDGRLLALDQRHRAVRIFGKQMLPEEALRQFPVRRQQAEFLHVGMNPVDTARLVWILDAVAGLGVIHHDFAGPAAALGVDLEEDDSAGTRDAQTIVQDELLNDHGVEDGFQEGDELGPAVKADGACDDVVRDEAEGLGLGGRPAGARRFAGRAGE